VDASQKETVIVADASGRGEKAKRCAKLERIHSDYARAVAFSGNPSTKSDGWHQRVEGTTEGVLGRRTTPQGGPFSGNRVVALADQVNRTARSAKAGACQKQERSRKRGLRSGAKAAYRWRPARRCLEGDIGCQRTVRFRSRLLQPRKARGVTTSGVSRSSRESGENEASRARREGHAWQRGAKAMGASGAGESQATQGCTESESAEAGTSE